MATWKKLVVSGSDISQLNNDAGYLTSVTAQHAYTTASINGVEFTAGSANGKFEIVTGSAGTGLTITGLDNAGDVQISFDLSAIPNSTLANDTITIGTTGIALGDSSTTLAGLTSVTSTGFTGSLSATSVLADGVTATTQTPGDNSTKVATTAYVDAVATAADLDLAGDGGTTTAVDLDSQTLTFTGADGIEASASAQTITVGIADGGIANAKLANSTISGISLGSNLNDLTVDDSSLQLNSGTTYNGSAARTISVKNGGITNDMLAGSIANGKLVNSSIKIGDASFALGTTASLAATGFNSGSFSGSFEGDGSGLTGIATNLDVSGSDGTGISIDLKTQDLTIDGTANEIETTVAGTTLTIGLPDDVTITQDLTVNRNLTVVGTASFQHETNLEVSDRFIRMASGSSAAGDGGIVIQQSADGLGEVFGFENSVSRWAVSSSFDGSASTFNAEAYMAAVLEGSADTATAIASAVPDAKYNAKGNIWIADSENIWIYS